MPIRFLLCFVIFSVFENRIEAIICRSVMVGFLLELIRVECEKNKDFLFIAVVIKYVAAKTKYFCCVLLFVLNFVPNLKYYVVFDEYLFK